jgi:hypothetical protein
MFNHLLTACLSVACLACNRGGSNMQSDVSIEQLGKRLGLQLPPGTQVVGVENESGLDDAIFAKLRVPSAYSQQFIRECGVTRLEPHLADLLGPDRGFWDPHQANKLKVGDIPQASTRGLVIGVDESHADALVVYVMNHGT